MRWCGRQVSSLEGVQRTLVVDVLDLRAARVRALESQTLLGNCKNLLGYCLSAYCLFRWASPVPPAHALHTGSPAWDVNRDALGRYGRGPAAPMPSCGKALTLTECA